MVMANRRLIRLTEAAKGVLPVSYATLFRLSREKDSPFLPAFALLGGALFVDPDLFLQIGQKENTKRAIERRT